MSDFPVRDKERNFILLHDLNPTVITNIVYTKGITKS